jgi:hypothetical protein
MNTLTISGNAWFGWWTHLFHNTRLGSGSFPYEPPHITFFLFLIDHPCQSENGNENAAERIRPSSENGVRCLSCEKVKDGRGAMIARHFQIQ